MYVGLVQVDIVIAVELKHLQEAGRVCLYVCIWHDLAGNLWGVDVLGIMLLWQLQLLLNILCLGFCLPPEIQLEADLVWKSDDVDFWN